MIIFHDENWAQLKINYGPIKVRQINDKPIGLIEVSCKLNHLRGISVKQF